jgi:thiol-disulfide isomerase/thioredoxin
MLSLLVFLQGLLVCSVSKSVYDHSKSHITPLTNFNFNDQINKIRQSTNYVSLVHFYKYEGNPPSHSDGKSKAFAPELDKWNNEYRGVFRTGAVDCDQYADLCKKEEITEFPTIKLYAPIPIPPTKFAVPMWLNQGELKTEEIMRWASKYLHSNVIEITNANAHTFMAEHPSVPKVLLFTDKKGVPMIYKGLSVAFEKKLNFGIVRSTDDILVQKYAVKKFPSIIVIKTGEKKPINYNG